MTPALRLASEQAVQVLTADGQRLQAGRAVLFVLAALGYPVRWLARPPFVWAVELGYRLVAGHRGFFARLMP